MSFVKNALKPGDRLHGFTVTRVSEALEGRASAVEAEHDQSGARLLHLYADDAENLFAIAFSTPPPDDTGLPHILEHTTLCGSQKYPVKDPFVELLKTSMATFLNAMTYPDKTVYPCASMNDRDYFNLARVYCDAVFHPRLTPEHFAQEGHHYDFATPGDVSSPLIVKGIVYNEMKGAYSDLDGVLSGEEPKRLFPDNAYGRDSGGDPHVIPQLTYQQFKDFHARYYHPSNSRIFIYGHIPTARHLEFLDKEYLSEYQRMAIDATIAPTAPWDAPRRFTVPYPASAEEEKGQEGAVQVSWATGDLTDNQRILALDVLDGYLLDNSASPLRKALIDSHLGGELTPSGFADHQRDTYFSVGLKGVAPDKAGAVEKLVLDTLRAEAARGLDRDKIATVFHQYEMSALEIKGAYPLRLMELVFRSWMYGGRATDSLNLRADLAALRERYEKTPRFFEDLLQSALVDNPHRQTLVVVPDAGYNAREAAGFAARMAKVKEGMTAAELEDVARTAARLDALQQAPNPPEALATLPKLEIADVSPDPVEFATTVAQENGQKILENDVFTNGINYFTLSVDLNDFDAEMLRHVPVYAAALERMGAGGMDYATLAAKEAACCSGVAATAAMSGRVDDVAAATPRLNLALRALDHKVPEALEMLRLRYRELDLSDEARLRDILTQDWHNQRAAVVSAGHTLAATHAARGLSPMAHWCEQLQGLTRVRLSGELAERFDPAKVLPVLKRIQAALQKGARFTASVAGGRAAEMRRWFAGFTAASGAGAVAQGDWKNVALDHEMQTAIAVPCEVAFVAKAFPTVNSTHEDAPALLLLSLNLSYGYLWNEVRARRGAYGCGASFAPMTGVFAFRSYRDPFINETLATYGTVADYVLREMDLSPASLAAAVIGTIKTLDHPLRPGYVVAGALGRELSGSTLEERRAFRSRLLSLTAADVRRAAERHLAPFMGASAAPVCVVSSREKLGAARAAGLPGLAIHDLF